MRYPKLLHKSYEANFVISPEMLEDDSMYHTNDALSYIKPITEKKMQDNGQCAVGVQHRFNETMSVITTRPDLQVSHSHEDVIQIARRRDDNSSQFVYLSIPELEQCLKAAKKMVRQNLLERAKIVERTARELSTAINAIK